MNRDEIEKKAYEYSKGQFFEHVPKQILRQEAFEAGYLAGRDETKEMYPSACSKHIAELGMKFRLSKLDSANCVLCLVRDDALEEAARMFEGHEQEFKTEDDSVSFTYRVMQIIAENIRALKEEK